jgi:hypothetical protein
MTLCVSFKKIENNGLRVPVSGFRKTTVAQFRYCGRILFGLAGQVAQVL